MECFCGLRPANCGLLGWRIYSTALTFKKGGLLMVVESVKKVKNIVSEVFKGYASNSSGGCCGVSLPPEEQRQLKRLKEGAQAEKKD
jgi:hypothetical protein